MSVKPLKQVRTHPTNKTAEDGDCYRTCIAMLLGEDSPDKVPDFSDPNVACTLLGWPKDCDYSEFAMYEWLLETKGYELKKVKYSLDNRSEALETIIQDSIKYDTPVMANISVVIGDELNIETICSIFDPIKLFDHSIIIDATQTGKTFLHDPDPNFTGVWDDKKKIKGLFPSRNGPLPHKRGYLPLTAFRNRYNTETIFTGHIKPIPKQQLDEKKEKCKELCDPLRENYTEEGYSALLELLGIQD